MHNHLRKSLTEQAHIWMIRVKSGLSRPVLNGYKSILSLDELAQYHRFHFNCDKYLYLIAHANLRIILSKYADVDPQDWIFERNSYGRPEVSESVRVPGLRFNMSHCPGMVVFLVNDQIDGGIDVERTDRIANPMQIAQTIFSPFEIKVLQKDYVSDDAIRTRFFEYWTLKEAFVKATGMGLSIPLNQFSFIIDKNSQIQIDFTHGMRNDPLTWQFILNYPTVDHIVAVALRKGHNQNLAIIQKEVVI